MSEKERSQSQLQRLQTEVERCQAKLQQTQVELERLRSVIAWMQTSKFWKLREQVLKLKGLLTKGLKVPVRRIFARVPQVPQNSSLLTIDIPRSLPQKPTLLLIVEASLPQCFRYRVQQKIEQLQMLDYEVAFVPWSAHDDAKKKLHFCHIVIFYRVPAFPTVVSLIKYAKQLRKIVLFDVDDLIFELDSLSEKVESFRGQLSEAERSELLKGAVLYHEAMSLCCYGIASTPALANRMNRVVGSGNSFVHRNAIDAVITQYLKSHPPKLSRDYLSIFYGSGTNTHDADFELVASALVQLLARHEHVRLTIIGYLKLPDSLTPYTDRIDRIKYLSIEPYFEFLSQADINIAPLEAGIFADCKSEIKWLEAAMLEIPSVVTGTQTYLEVLEDGSDALIAYTPQDWFEKLDALVNSPELRHTIAQNAHAKAWRNYHPSTMAKNLKQILSKAIDQSSKQGLVVVEEQNKKLLFVNVLYPPQALGGATVIMKNIIDTLRAKRNDYEISVFTYQIQNPIPYELSEYTHDGIHVTALSVTDGADLDWRYQDAQVYNIFREYLAFAQPDLIHFHCVQRLTASMLEAAEELAIPYLVTVHDAWWLSDHQFLINKDGVECDPRQNDPLIAARYTDDISNAIARRRYLANRLNKAEALLAVSEFQAQLYRQNGFAQIQVNRNGILPQPVSPRTPAPSNQVRLGYAGGICVHKGYYFLKEAVNAANLQNSELIVIDLSFTSGAERHQTWDQTPVTFIPKLPAQRMPEFYSRIDVLVAPSLWAESFGLITREAALAGVWLVASDKGGLAEDIRPGIDGDIFSPDSVDKLVAILERIDKDPARYRQPIPAATHIRTIDKQVNELEILYETILNEINETDRVNPPRRAVRCEQL